MTAKAKEKIVWQGPQALRRFLVPVGSLEPWPGNPRRGDVQAIAASLRRFGQVKPVVVRGGRIVAGHHIVAAGHEELGWTHVAVLDHEFADEDEAHAFLLADNRVGQLGGYEQELLIEHLRHLAEMDGLEGTGWSTDDLDDQLAALARMGEDGKVEVAFRAKPPDDVRELVLLYSPAQREQLEVWLKVVAKERGVEGLSETIYVASEVAARMLSQGAAES